MDLKLSPALIVVCGVLDVSRTASVSVWLMCVNAGSVIYRKHINMRQAVSQVLSAIFLFFFFQKRGSSSFTCIGFENKNRWKYCFKTLNSMGCLT